MKNNVNLIIVTGNHIFLGHLALCFSHHFDKLYHINLSCNVSYNKEVP
jgi:hypothetical protein